MLCATGCFRQQFQLSPLSSAVSIAISDVTGDATTVVGDAPACRKSRNSTVNRTKLCAVISLFFHFLIVNINIFQICKIAFLFQVPFKMLLIANSIRCNVI